VILYLRAIWTLITLLIHNYENIFPTLNSDSKMATLLFGDRQFSQQANVSISMNTAKFIASFFDWCGCYFHHILIFLIWYLLSIFLAPPLASSAMQYIYCVGECTMTGTVTNYILCDVLCHMYNCPGLIMPWHSYICIYFVINLYQTNMAVPLIHLEWGQSNHVSHWVKC
jgi:hypothetical protein